jgi:hypothetical protein
MNLREVLVFFNALIYIWVAYETGLIASLYRYAYSEMKESKVISSCVVFSASLAVFFMFRAIFSLGVYFLGTEMELLVTLTSLPTIFVALSARHFRKKSLEKDKTK